ncbi:MAG TPA: UTRA domain-containing protein, partial [Jiangellaceae bacterium]|nr:UTRA domain-containing protein [Jiangellaceae bacterium]
PHAELLEMPVGAAALFATQLGFDRHGHRIELGRSVYRGDKFDFTTVTFSARRPQPVGVGTRSRAGGPRRTTAADPVTEQSR